MRLRSARVVVALAVIVLASTVGASSGVARGSGTWHLVAFSDRVTQDDRDALHGAGARALQYYPEDSYLAWLTEPGAGRVAALPGVVSARPLEPAEKIDPALEPTTSPRPILASVYAPALEAALPAIASRFRVAAIHAVPRTDLRDVIVVEPAAVAMALAALPEVMYVGPGPSRPTPLDELSDQIVAGKLSGSTAPPGYEQFLQSVGLSGAGVRLSIADSGVDAHPDFQDRIVERIEYTALGSGPVGEQTDMVGHGTHVAGIAGGNPTTFPAIGRVRDAAGHAYGLGIAPGVELVDQDVLSATASGVLCNLIWPPSYPWNELTEDALDAGAHIWNASWWSCENDAADYIETARVFDFLARDGDTRAAGAQPFTFVHAAGNFGPGNSTIGSPGAAKNLITVGSTNNARSGGNPNAMANSSSRGPMADGRVGPTVSAPGANIISTRSFAGAVCNVPPADSFGLYANCSGTSMASPHVAGAVALITEWWRKSHGGADPSPAMAKALLVNTATDMGPPNIPNKDEGWGRVNIGALFDPSAQRIYSDQETVLTELGDAVSYRIAAIDPSKPLKVTLTWSDAPGAAGADPVLVNDLDLSLTREDGAVYWGNAFMNGVSVSPGAPDRLNNVENVFIASPSQAYTLRVGVENLPEDGVPFVGDQTDQDFALVISNGAVVPA